MFLKVLALAVVIGVCLACEVSQDCNDKEGRSLCYEKKCRRDVPCNKDNDCFFYGAADVSQGFPHPRCYLNKHAERAPGYGVCMLSEFADGLKRIPGGDVIDVRDVENKMTSIRDTLNKAYYRLIKKK
ncbi:uncharacterized protein LOC123554067 [Mercenaria mercenaria]|uniref:uncharacterized protein LOC123554067 n=1 Tax=Mercenaria mercenaria TaxID=6596 RepID=UPI001E1D912D|nr:uncharacterized protein LOC123554067 [Mercenaria mercenaria]